MERRVERTISISSKGSERFSEYEIAFIVRRNSAQLYGNRKLLVVKWRKSEGRIIRAGSRKEH